MIWLFNVHPVALLLALVLLCSPSPGQETEDYFRSSVVRITASDGTIGSGFIVEVSQAVFVLTVSRILEKGDETPTVEFHVGPGRSYRSMIEGIQDGDEGLALLRIEAPFPAGLAALSAAQVSPVVGQSIQVLGFPYSRENRLAVVSGSVSSRSGWNTVVVTEPAGDGSLGGPVVSGGGSVVGVLTRAEAGLGTATMASIAQVFLEGYGLNWGAPGLPPPPSDIEGPIFGEEYIGPPNRYECSRERSTDVLVIKWGQESPYQLDDLVFFTRDDRGVQRQYLIADRMSRATASWIPKLMAVGRRVRLKYVLCEKGAKRYLTYIEPLPARR